MGWTAADLDAHHPRHLTGVWDVYVARARYLAGQVPYLAARDELVADQDISETMAQAVLARTMSPIRIKNYIGVDVTDEQVERRAQEALNA